MNLNKIVIYLTVIAIIAIIAIPTSIKVVSENHEKLYLVNEKLVTEKARQCIYDGKCKENKVTLKTLYDNMYIKGKVIDPVKKSVYSEESYVIVTKEDATFYPKQ